jgi:hypothetical protein
VRPFALAALLCAAGCVDTNKCHMATAWLPCAGETAQPGASGTPPTIVELALPTCGFVDSPTVTGTIHVSDPDADSQLVKITFFAGKRVNEIELPIAAANAAMTDWSDALSVAVGAESGGGGMSTEGTFDVRIKVTDRAGNQSQPYCGSIALLR